MVTSTEYSVIGTVNVSLFIFICHTHSSYKGLGIILFLTEAILVGVE